MVFIVLRLLFFVRAVIGLLGSRLFWYSFDKSNVPSFGNSSSEWVVYAIGFTILPISNQNSFPSLIFQLIDMHFDMLTALAPVSRSADGLAVLPNSFEYGD